MGTELTISDVARRVGVSSRTLRHYDHIGLLKPTRVGPNGYRLYGQSALVRLQRILLLRELGLGLPAIQRVLEHRTDDVAALREHLDWLHAERARIDAQFSAVQATIRNLEEGRETNVNMFDGFDHTRYRDEVIERWGEGAYEQANEWWDSQSALDRAAFQEEHEHIARSFADAAQRGLSPEGDDAQAVSDRLYAWLMKAPGVPRSPSGDFAQEYFLSLADMYVQDARFRMNYDKFGEGTADYVRECMHVFARAHWASH